MPWNEEREVEVELAEHGRLVFFPFHEPIARDEVKCLDGSVYVDDEDEAQLDIDVADSYGYVVEVRGGQIAIRGALYDGSSGPAPTPQMVEECGVLEERMGAYVQRFVHAA
jgi:hypothetical protein